MNNITGSTDTRTEPGYKLNCARQGEVVMNNITGSTDTRTEPGYKLNCARQGEVGRLSLALPPLRKEEGSGNTPIR